MRRILYFLCGVAILALLGWNVWRAETLIASGRTVLLALAPADPRSLMQGDYMRLRWDLERASEAIPARTPVVVLSLDEKSVGTYRRVPDTAALGQNEVLFALKVGDLGRPIIEPHSYLFQEGTADAHAKAKYGIFRVAPDGRHLLVGLADEAARPIEAPSR